MNIAYTKYCVGYNYCPRYPIFVVSLCFRLLLRTSIYPMTDIQTSMLGRFSFQPISC